jgi:tetratricopeptide (TPR) repeat protein
MQSGDLDGAEAAFEKFITQKPDNVDARFNLANVLFTKGQYGPAADNYREAVRLRPEFARAHYNLAITLERLKDSRAAQQEFHEAHRLDPTLVAP